MMMDMFIIALVLTTSLTQLTNAGSAPQIITKGSVFNVIPGVKVLMSCDTIGTPRPIIKWERDGKPIVAFGERFSVNTDSNALRIFNTRVEDQGNYTCTAKNKFGADKKTISLFVMVQPDVSIVYPSNLTFMELTNQELVCRTRAIPMPFFEWLTNNNQRIRENASESSSARMYSKTREIGKNLYESILVFQPITFHDYGSFACVAYNDIGHSRVSVTLDVKFPPKVLSNHKHPQPVAWWTGYKSNLTCVVAGNDLPTISWTKNGHFYKCNNLDEWIEHGKITTSCMIDQEDGGPGIYTCSADNKLGNILVHEFHVRENFPPPPVEFTPINMTLDELTLSVFVPFREDTPPASFVLASYKQALDNDISEHNPEYERMGDLNHEGKGTVKLVAVEENSEYIVTIKARNSVGFGLESVKIINTDIHQLFTTTTVMSRTQTSKYVLDNSHANMRYYTENDNEYNNGKVLDTDSDKLQEHVLESEENLPTAYSVIGSDDNSAESMFKFENLLTCCLVYFFKFFVVTVIAKWY